ncbi:ribonuclease HII [Oceanobacillus sp. 1P07AA]|uniref:ribonuclease HII n=1 Tax=Oceanobacillus sp. 1P07AA TaxID=3132293 RepID=UPI0039A46DBD
MKPASIASIKTQLNNGELTNVEIEELYKDSRKGVQAILKRYEKQQEKQEALKQAFIKMNVYENKAYGNGNDYIAGVDEVGRGPLAGPVVAAAVILPKDFELLGINDSKKLSEEQRNTYSDYIKQHAIAYQISFIDNTTIDKINIYEASKQAMKQAISGLDPYPDHALIDAVPLEGINCTYEAIIKGDSASVHIAAASILAKVARDNWMKELHEKYPVYGFNSNMGYGTKEHLQALEKYGTTPYHRYSFAPVHKYPIASLK